jgi:hypothetical protein
MDRNLHETTQDHMFGNAILRYSKEIKTAGGMVYASTTNVRSQVADEKKRASREFGCGANKTPN